MFEQGGLRGRGTVAAAENVRGEAIKVSGNEMVRANLGHVLRFLTKRKDTALSVLDQAQFSPFLVQLVVTRKCNLKCSYCNESDRVSEPVPYETLFERIRKIRSLGSLSIEFTGGEPLLHPRLVELVAGATAMNFPRRMLISNAILMKDDVIRAFNDAGLTYLQVSVDGVSSNSSTKKTLDTLRPRLEALSRLAKFQVVMSGVMGTCPPEETLEMLDFARDHDFVPRVLLIHDHTGKLKMSPSELAAYREVKRRIGPRFSESGEYRERLIRGETAPFKCRAGARYIYVDELGDAHWCSQKKTLFSKPILEYTLEDLKEQFHTKKGGCEPLCTVGCARSCSSKDEFRRQDIVR
jgi:MoaA/NifB/PqqE/SkfB family radical SAM enzyme